MRMLVLAGACAALLEGPAHATVTMDWVQIGNPGNAPDPSTCYGEKGCGQVNYTYYISKYDVTNAQYAEFLNTVDPSGNNALGLYSTLEASDTTNGGITNTGAAGSVYQVRAGFANDPVVYVSFWDAVRFANWLNNGQGTASTETGAYTITPDGIANDTITRNPGAITFVPSENEWFKAAYYNPFTNSYFAYPAGSSTPTVCAAPGATANTANCANVVGHVTPVGAYTGSASPYGTFDQGGNVWQWNETILTVVQGTIEHERGWRGGSWNYDNEHLWSLIAGNSRPEDEDNFTGFRVASLVPEPGTGLLVMVGVVGLAAMRHRQA